MRGEWIRRRWFDFRSGHSIYLVFVLTFINFILITYRLLIEKVSYFQTIITDLWIFVVLFVVIYIPAAIALGYWHRTTQLKVETTIGMLENPMFARLFRVLIDMQLGKASKQEIEEIRELLFHIEQKMYGKDTEEK